MNKVVMSALCLSLISASLPAHAAKVKCSDFKSQKEAQAYFDAKKPGYKGLDRDKDGIACEALK
ncbi:excalibur calcium-binding domain-containing protein [Psychrobacter phenylpyruvicus]|uniref:Excalibur calcium-binding domain n=1 Tax=Psychrobacter phenylpyruvicus TaxID=29432 RepID=A0A379LM37_9GAMM|nr:excalibur calcium-binding domain-containing protein [Psychrobacter phenylpyruvicus]SUD91613.1 Excalibur calcium-binding domain [Psychrobacter phenylpyruvicus]